MNFGVRRAYLDENPHLITLTDKEKQLRLPFNRNKLLQTYYNIISEYYKSLESYYGIIKDYDKEGLTEIKKEMVKIYVKILKIRKILSTIEEKGEDYKEGFKKVKVMEDLITNFIDLLENRWRANGMMYEDDFEINSVNVKILRLELMKKYKFLITHKPNIEIEEELKIARKQLEMLEGERAIKMDLQKARRIVPEPVHKYKGVVPAVINPKRIPVKRAFPIPAMPATIIAERQSTPSFPLPPPYPQQEFAPTIQAGPAALRISRTPRTSQKPLTPEELLSRANALIIAAANVSPNNKKVDILRPSDTRGLGDIYPPVNFLPAQSPARRLSQRPPLAPLAPAAASKRRNIRPLPKGAPELLAQVMPSRSHSFKSNSPRNDEKPEFDIVSDKKGTPEVYLIDAVNDGLCFLNAIFDYLLYSDKLSIMYERLSAIEKLILKQDKYKTDNDILRIKRGALSQLDIKEGTYDIFIKEVIPVSASNVNYYIKRKEKGQLIRLKGDERLKFIDNQDKVEHLGHPKGKDKKDDYEKQRLIFAKSMKYIVALYILSYGKKKFSDIITDAIKNTLFIKVEGEADPYRNEWNQKLLDYYHANYYTFGNEIYRKTDGAVATPEDIADFVYQYVFEYMNDNGFFANQTLITMFKKILFKKIKNTEGKNIPRFWLEFATSRTEYQNLRATTIFDRVLNKYRFKTLPNGKYIHKDDKYDNYISLLCDQNRTHYLLFLLKSELKYDVVDKPTGGGGGKPKRPKTATKPKLP
jgi:hypothetical protein